MRAQGVREYDTGRLLRIALHEAHTMEAFFFFALFWLIGWAVFLLSALAERDGRRIHSHTLLDDIEIEL
ncbi:MAG: hypothetical protein KA144_09645 [Xanthomonadaceae bacterium]|nr:hypothetical protein [Xanthomonadaceae bacterium]MCC7248355.1 hypothetical protein [Lysobacter sp.]